MSRRAVILTNVEDAKGLAADGLILRERLRAGGWNADLMDYRRQVGAKNPYDLGIACEIQPTRQQMTLAGTWWFAPNPEWTSPEKLERLGEFDRVLLKTHWSRALTNWGPRAVVTGFESADVAGRGSHFVTPIEVLHPCGSISRGGVVIVQAWKRICAARLDCGAQLIVTRPPPTQELTEELKSSPRTKIRGLLPEAAYREQQRRASVHVICSEHEGYGHAFWEALSAGATVVATAGPWWAKANARGAYRAVEAKIHPGAVGCRMLAPRHFVDVDALTEDLAAAIAEAPIYQETARSVYDDERAAFRRRFADLLEKF